MKIRKVEPTVVAEYEVEINIEILSNASIAASVSAADKFPGIDKFLSDVKQMLENDFNCDVKEYHKSKNSNKGSISIYFVFDYLLSATESIKCTVLLRISDHRDDSTYTAEHRRYVRQLEQKYNDPTSERIEDEVIIVDDNIYMNYSSSLDNIRDSFTELIQGWKLRYRL